MATQTVSYTSYDVSTAAGVRAFGSSISNAIQATGLTKTANTGQVDWTTVTAATTLGSEIYQFNDTLQSTAPVFLKVTYTMAVDGTSSPAWPYISTIQLGRATNGDTTFTSGVTVSLNFNATLGNTNTGTGNWTWRFCYNAAMGFFGLMQWDDPSITTTTGPRNSMFFSRVCDDTGNPTASGVFMQAIGAAVTSTNGSNQLLSYDTDTQTTYSNGAVPGINTASTLITGTTAQFLRQTVACPTVRTVPQVLYYAAADIPRGTTVTLSPYGSSHTYVTAGVLSTTSTNGALAMLWE